MSRKADGPSDQFEALGLEEQLATPYIAILRKGPLTASRLAREIKAPRPSVYRLLEQLADKGLVSSVLRNNVKCFSAAPPRKLLEDQQRRCKRLAALMPQLEAMRIAPQAEFRVEVFEGKEGIIAVMRHVLREGKDYVVLGEEGKFQEVLPILIRQILRDAMKLGLRERLLSKESKRGRIITTRNTSIRYLPDEFFSPTLTAVFGDYIAIFDWQEPYHAILIKSRNTAQSYRSYFEALWKIAKR